MPVTMNVLQLGYGPASISEPPFCDDVRDGRLPFPLPIIVLAFGGNRNRKKEIFPAKFAWV